MSRNVADAGRSGSKLPSQPHSVRMLSPVDVADQLQVSVKTVRRLITAGELRVHRLGRQLRVTPDDLVAYVRSRRR